MSPEEHYALLREGMFSVENKADAQEEAILFLRYFLDCHNIDPLPWLGEALAHHWCQLRDWDRRWGKNYADKLLRDYIAANDFDHWTALNLIAARLHRERQPLPDALADWAAELHEGKEAPAKEKGNKGEPPYAHEDRNRVYFVANNWLEYFGMASAEDRIHVIATWLGHDESVIRKGLTRWRKEDWRRAPWPTFPSE